MVACAAVTVNCIDVLGCVSVVLRKVVRANAGALGRGGSIMILGMLSVCCTRFLCLLCLIRSGVSSHSMRRDCFTAVHTLLLNNGIIWILQWV